jgi:hypothetical protein
MMKFKPQGRPLTPNARRRLRQVMYDSHVRAFGKELARIHFLPEVKRLAP